MLLQHVIKTLFGLLLVLNPLRCDGQNMIFNGGFELRKKCPYALHSIRYSTGWNSPTKGTPDYFNACSYRSRVGAPNNFAGNLTPFEGDGYVGMRFFFELPNNNRYYKYSDKYKGPYREYIQNKLVSSLEKGKKYVFKMQIALAGIPETAVCEIEVLFSNKKKKERTDSMLTHYDSKKLLTLEWEDSIQNKWIELEGYFIADGSEEFVTIGWFKEYYSYVEVEPLKKAFDREKAPYYFIDNVTLSEVVSE